MVKRGSSQSRRKSAAEPWRRSEVVFQPSLLSHKPEHVIQSELESRRTANAIFVKAAEKHFKRLFATMDSFQCAILVSDPYGIVLADFGDESVISSLHRAGIGPGIVAGDCTDEKNVIACTLAEQSDTTIYSSSDSSSQWQSWNWAGVQVEFRESGLLVGVLAVATPQADTLPAAKMLLQSSSVALSNWMELEETKRNITRIHHSLISQLDYHVIFTDESSSVLDERHPIPISETARTQMQSLTLNGAPLHEEVQIDRRTYLVDIRQLTDHKGESKGTLGLFHDLSQHKRWESQLKDMEKMSTLTSLAAGIAHEIRNPLTAAKGFLQLFTERISDVEERRFLDLTVTELDRINALVKDFMSLARPVQTEYNRIDLSQAVSEAVHFTQPEAALHGVNFEVDMSDEPLWTWGDANHLKQVLLNVVQNALHACTSNRGTVTLAVKQMDAACVIEIHDTGIGIPKQEMDKIFQPFFTTKESGTGLGLAISRRIIEDHGGKIAIESQPNQGTTVRITLELLKNPRQISESAG
ncbi:nitrogen regulation protein NR(II) [Alicyclobacillus sp. SO9]|uniref:two-component system sensor histidine kinase NtrB n=1 Tax=Alicyclobacillus sp. SO9 TaxID=2665646 RepID=UPI0018E766BB|nr:ATP-binding protein [Alicyclobacillus sp. SO9]QQE79979.1 GHKL domain-containing protein [Alicyclobacillus sp. SO9]